MHQKGVAVISSNLNLISKLNDSLLDCKDFTKDKDIVSKSFYKMLSCDLLSSDKMQNIKPTTPITPSQPSVKPDGSNDNTLDSLDIVSDDNTKDSLYSLESKNNNGKQKNDANKRQKETKANIDSICDDESLKITLQKQHITSLNMTDYKRLYQNLSLKLRVSLDRDLNALSTIELNEVKAIDSLLDDYKTLLFTSKIISFLDDNIKAQLLNQNIPRYIFDQGYMPYIYLLFFKFAALKERLKKNNKRYSKSLYKEYKKKKDAKKQNHMALLL